MGDPALQKVGRNWSKTAEGLVHATSEYFEREFQVRFVVVKVAAWPVDKSTRSTKVLLSALKKDFPLKGTKDRIDMIIGFTGESVDRYGAGRARVDRLGNCHDGLASYMVSAVTDPFFYRPNSQEITWDALAVIHEMGHAFGAEHNNDENSIMHRDFGYRTEFDKRNRDVILKNRMCPFARK